MLLSHEQRFALSSVESECARQGEQVRILIDGRCDPGVGDSRSRQGGRAVMLNLLPDGRRDQDATEVGQELEGIEFVEVNEWSGVADNGCCLSRSHAGPTRRPCARTRP
jgi:hypothetical protein